MSARMSGNGIISFPLDHNSGKCGELVGTAAEDSGRVCERHPAGCGRVLRVNDVLRLRAIIIEKGNKKSQLLKKVLHINS